jgi:hypothetical protein
MSQNSISPSVSFHDAFVTTLKKFPEINRKHLSNKCSLSDSLLSRFISGESDIAQRKLWCLINNLPEEAQTYFWQLLQVMPDQENAAAYIEAQKGMLRSSLKAFVAQCSEDEFQEIFGILVAARGQALSQ